jgi:hypothetical protein
MKDIAMVRLVGSVTESKDGSFLLQATEDLILKIFGDAKAGDRVRVIGELDPDRSGGATVKATSIEKVKKGMPSEALAKIVAKMFRSHRHLDAKAGKQAVGFGTLVWGDIDKPKEARFARYVSFDPLSTDLKFGRLDGNGKLKLDDNGRPESAPAVQGSIMQLIGSLRKRYFVSQKTGKPGIGIDIVADERLTRVLKAAEIVDPFAEIAPTMLELTDEVPF